MESKIKDSTVACLLLHKDFVSVFKTGAPNTGTALGSADLGMTPPFKVNTKETANQKAEKVNVLNILNINKEYKIFIILMQSWNNLF